MTSVLLAWEQRYSKLHPDTHFENRMIGSDTAMPGLEGGIADIALLGREPNTPEKDGFLHTFQYPALQLHLMKGSLATPGKSYAPVLFVSKTNSLGQLTLRQVDQLFGCGQPGVRPARVWGDLGLTNDWKNKPIRLYMFDATSGPGIFFLSRLQGESQKMNWTLIREFRTYESPDGSTHEAGQQTMDALDRDPFGLAVSSLSFVSEKAKALALAAGPHSPYVLPTVATLMDDTYPLGRMTYAFVNRPSDGKMRPLVQGFLSFIYSVEGMQIVSAQRGFLPLSRSDAAEQLRKLK